MFPEKPENCTFEHHQEKTQHLSRNCLQFVPAGIGGLRKEIVRLTIFSCYYPRSYLK